MSVDLSPQYAMKESTDGGFQSFGVDDNNDRLQKSRSRAHSKVAIILLLLAFVSSVLILPANIPSKWYHNVASKTVGDSSKERPFYANVSSIAGSLCPGVGVNTPSYSGHIGLKGDTNSSPRRSFFWYFGAESHDPNAPVILTMGGGPGTSGLMNAFFGQSPCLISANGLVSNPNSWTERYNLIVLDHPIGVGFSYGGPQVNNSRDAARDVYDFLQKFYVLFPELSGNKLIVDGGSYGGIYVPNIATVIQEGNRAVASGKGQPGAKRILLESLMIHNPFTDPFSHFRWLLQYRCVYHSVYNSTQCEEAYALLPSCLEALDFASEPENNTPQNRFTAIETCGVLSGGFATETPIENIELDCHPGKEGIAKCYPEFKWMIDFFTRSEVKAILGVPLYVNYTSLNIDVSRTFSAYGEKALRHHHLYEPLLEDGIRVLHYVGAQDANCAWPGVLAFLKLIRGPYQKSFINSKEIPWPTTRKEEGYVRVVGEGAGNFTFVLIEGAGHFNVHEKPAVVKSIIEHWIENEEFSGKEV